MPTLADVLKVYVKPSLDGTLVIRKRTSMQTSPRLAARKAKVKATKGKDTAPARVAHKACVDDKKTVKKLLYVPGEGYKEKDVCPIKTMKSYLRAAMKGV
jgi:hypothetical protein